MACPLHTDVQIRASLDLSVPVTLRIAKEAGLYAGSCVIPKVSLTHVAFMLSYFILQNWQLWYPVGRENRSNNICS
jgi:hypothetical protein